MENGQQQPIKVQDRWNPSNTPEKLIRENRMKTHDAGAAATAPCWVEASAAREEVEIR